MLITTGDEAKRGSASSLLPAVVVLAIASTAWFAVNQRSPHGPLVLGWISPPVSLALSAVALRDTAATPRLSAAARRFWQRITVVAVICAVGMVLRAGYTVDLRTERGAVPFPAGALYIGAVLYAVWALLQVPGEPRTPAQWVRLSLDCATVVLGAAVFLWYVAFSPMLASDGTHDSQPLLAVGVICLTGVAALTKILLTGAGPVDMGALRLLGLGLLVGGISAGTATMVVNQSHLLPGQVSVPFIAVLLVLAGQRQQRAAGRRASAGPAAPAGAPSSGERPAYRSWRPDPVSLLPYAAVVATDGLLVLATVGRVDDRRYVVVAGAIVITALVAVRQVVAFADNARLVHRLRQQEERLRHQASHDELTRLANRSLFGERLDAALAAGAVSRDVTVLLIDLDDFKAVNDTLGHGVGDRLLAEVAERVGRCVRSDDTVARLGGDEFAVLLRDAWPARVDGVTEEILASLRRPIVVDGYELLVQASIGITGARPGDDPETVLRNADIAMYRAKERGKGSAARYAPGMAAGILEHARLGAQLRQALEGGQFRLLYQPVVRLSDRRVIGMEALVRWRRPGRGEVSPVDFIPTAERTGLIVPLGRWVLREACRQKARWATVHGATCPATIGVNVSGRQLQDPGFADDVADAVHEAGLEPHNLVLEVTETAVLAGGQAIETLHALHAFGVSLALDDFGTGQSSLGLIRTCPVHILKLDKSFVMDTDGSGAGEHSEQQAAVAAAVVHIADALGLDAVAEGIECQEQADRMVGLGYRLGQGFHLARPLPADEIEGLLAVAAASR